MARSLGSARTTRWVELMNFLKAAGRAAPFISGRRCRQLRIGIRGNDRVEVVLVRAAGPFKYSFLVNMLYVEPETWALD